MYIKSIQPNTDLNADAAQAHEQHMQQRNLLHPSPKSNLIRTKTRIHTHTFHSYASEPSIVVCGSAYSSGRSGILANDERQLQLFSKKYCGACEIRYPDPRGIKRGGEAAAGAT